MQVAFVAPFGLAPKSSTLRRVMPMARALVAHGLGVRVVVPPYDDPNHFGRRWDDHGVQVVCLERPPLYGVRGLGAAMAQLALARSAVGAVDRRRPDLVHIFKPKAVSGLAQLMLWRRRRLPLVLDVDDWEGRAGWSAYEDYPRWLVKVFDLQERLGMQRCDAITAASRTLETRARDLRPDASALHIPNGFDAATYAAWGELPGRSAARAELGYDQADRVVLIFTRFFEYPPNLLLEVVQRMAGVDARVRFLIVGVGKYGQEDDLAAALRRENLERVARFTGWLDFAALPAVLAACDIGLLPMLDTLANRAKCSVRFVDFMVAGLPVVATPVGETQTYITDGRTGYVAENASAGAVAETALRALADPERIEVARRASDHARKVLAWSTLVEPLIDMYARVAAAAA